jgi:hypothetical protein
MSRYAFDGERHALVVGWGTGVGDVVHTVGILPSGLGETAALGLAAGLTRLAGAAWRTYTHPASAYPTDAEEEIEDHRGERNAFAAVPDALRAPHLPTDGLIIGSYIAVEEAAHDVGRTLLAVGDAKLTESVVTDVAAELDAVERAELGDLSGRAKQAVTVTHPDASPVQVMAADAVLRDDPLGRRRLLTDVDPTAAAVAAAHWLHAAATVVAERASLNVTDILVEADNIEALPHQTPTVILEMIEDGQKPLDAVVELVTDAMMVAEGRIPDIDALIAAVEEAEERAGALNQGDDVRRALPPSRLTPLDPRRPAVDLLEDLLEGIRGCWLLYREYLDDSDDEDEAPSDDPCEYSEHRRRMETEKFYAEVRAAAHLLRDRIL